MSLATLLKESETDKELWHYTSLAPYKDLKFTPPAANQTHILPPAQTPHRLVFIDGVLRQDLSAFGGLPDALITMDQQAGEDGCCYHLTLGGQACLAIDPMELLFVTSESAAPDEATTRLAITLGENSRLTLLESHLGGGHAPQVRHIKTTVTLAPQAKLVHAKIVRGGDEMVHVDQTQLHAARGAFYDHFTLITAGKLTRCEKNIALTADFAGARIAGVMLLRGRAQADITNVIDHQSPYGTSHQLCRAALADMSKGVFQGKVHVHQGAQKTDAYQLCRALLLSPQAEMNAKPELEIYADDVKCSHGTAIGDMDEEALFYLAQRGIPETQARHMLIEAFVAELSSGIQSPACAQFVQKEVTQWLSM